MRYVLEGEWTGYVQSQRRVVHREVINGKRALRLKKLQLIRYTDGTALLIYIRPAKHREIVRPINSYTELIQDAERSGQSVYAVSPITLKDNPHEKAQDVR
jgi:hypothetical protein